MLLLLETLTEPELELMPVTVELLVALVKPVDTEMKDHPTPVTVEQPVKSKEDMVLKNPLVDTEALRALVVMALVLELLAMPVDTEDNKLPVDMAAAAQNRPAVGQAADTVQGAAGRRLRVWAQPVDTKLYQRGSSS